MEDKHMNKLNLILLLAGDTAMILIILILIIKAI